MCDCRARWDNLSSCPVHPSSGGIWHSSFVVHRRNHLSVKNKSKCTIQMCILVVSASHTIHFRHPAVVFSCPALVPTNCSCLGEADDRPVPETLFKDRSLSQGLPLNQHSMTTGHAHSCRVLQITNGLSRVQHAVSSLAPLPCRPHGGKLGPSTNCAANWSTKSTTPTVATSTSLRDIIKNATLSHILFHRKDVRVLPRILSITRPCQLRQLFVPRLTATFNIRTVALDCRTNVSASEAVHLPFAAPTFTALATLHRQS